jgi:hypothetical protein
MYFGDGIDTSTSKKRIHMKGNIYPKKEKGKAANKPDVSKDELQCCCEKSQLCF